VFVSNRVNGPIFVYICYFTWWHKFKGRLWQVHPDGVCLRVRVLFIVVVAVDLTNLALASGGGETEPPNLENFPSLGKANFCLWCTDYTVPCMARGLSFPPCSFCKAQHSCSEINFQSISAKEYFARRPWWPIYSWFTIWHLIRTPSMAGQRNGYILRICLVIRLNDWNCSLWVFDVRVAGSQ
jgi:hypothetical protein